LTKLEQAGYIAPADPAQVPFSTDRPSRVFALTPAGRERFYQLMMDTTSNQGTYQRLFRIKALHLEYVSPEDRLSLVDHYLSYCQMGLRYQQAEARDFVTNPIKQQSVSSFYSAVALDLMELVSQQWQLELAWAQRLRERIVAAQALQKTETQLNERNEHVH
jgi:DNA-binding PadR family transcriptional regulator